MKTIKEGLKKVADDLTREFWFEDIDGDWELPTKESLDEGFDEELYYA